jgi:hypothetical protein
MRIVKSKSWAGFRKFLDNYSGQKREKREPFIFRGHASSEWELKSTLDRECHFSNDEDRERSYKGLLEHFEREATGLIADRTSLPEGDAFELLARHLGVPSPILDWTQSPYIASFFAFETANPGPKTRVAIWVFDRSVFSAIGSGIEIIDDLDSIRFNRRALQQRGLFTRVQTIRRSVEEILDDALTKIEIPTVSQSMALADLDEMGINAAFLFGDLDGAARTARYRLKS